MEDFRGRHISVIGAARSGIAAARALTRLGANVLLSDSQTSEKMGVARTADVETTGARFVFGASIADALPEGTELVVTSPGVPRTAAVLQEAVRRGLPIWSEIELAYRLTDAPILAITGTNGKTTTTLLLAAMLQAAGKKALVAGNVSADEIKCTLVEAASLCSPSLQDSATAYCRAVETAATRARSVPSDTQNSSIESAQADFVPLSQRIHSPAPLLVAEISSFQLEWVEKFAPKVAILTNVTPDHLNRHADFAEYAQAKARLFAAQSADDWAFLNWDNPTAREIGQTLTRQRRGWFTRQSEPPDDAPAGWVQDGVLMARLDSGSKPISLLRASELPFTLPGVHSIENTLAAALAALAIGADAGAVAEAARSFPGVAHRMEFVAEIGGARYINNSMCTNVVAAVRSLEAMDRPTVVIAGGADKELDFAPLTPALCAKAKHLILIGAVADKMERTFRANGYDAITRADTLEEAVQLARGIARPGEAVLLSPACASFDMFADFEARGAAFRRAALSLTEAAS